MIDGTNIKIENVTSKILKELEDIRWGHYSKKNNNKIKKARKE